MEIPSDLVPVKGYPGWKRDSSGIIHNTNTTAIKRAQEKKEQRKIEKERLNNLENDVKEIKNMMKSIMEKL